MAPRGLACISALTLFVGVCTVCLPARAQTPAVKAAAVAASAARGGSPWTALEHDGL
ncbi:MAG: hypothetical protein RLZZ524_144, partial [Pseudomonadota bacterium]